MQLVNCVSGCVENQLPIRRNIMWYITPKGGKYSVGGKYEDGYMKASIRELGTYTVAIDTIPPEIIPVNKNQWGRNGKIVYRLKDRRARELLPIVERLTESMRFSDVPIL